MPWMPSMATIRGTTSEEQVDNGGGGVAGGREDKPAVRRLLVCEAGVHHRHGHRVKASQCSSWRSRSILFTVRCHGFMEDIHRRAGLLGGEASPCLAVVLNRMKSDGEAAKLWNRMTVG